MTEKRAKRDKKFSVEELYQNKNFVPPKEKNLETIFEEPRKSKDGMPILTSVRKYRRYLHFDPTEGKIQKRKMKAKKCINKIKLNSLRTRSSTKTVRNEDISLYILETIGESSDSDMDVSHQEPERTSGELNKTKPCSTKKVSKILVSRKKTESVPSVQEICDPTPNPDALEETSDSQKAQETISTSESQRSTKTENLPEDSKEDSCPEKLKATNEESPRRSSCIIN
ncbi:hypothetical protein AVEN_250739-1 [Araneus ventricosus]|uniref:Tantalus-like domain-containing protein n=1 Tax=Araneus ventricosus TaxID=182803 RepID=A0A4Y2DXQ0_ARAVE|nr:hypothetical protein AVEN_250739-1 [Araneus ventricosus]